MPRQRRARSRRRRSLRSRRSRNRVRRISFRRRRSGIKSRSIARLGHLVPRRLRMSTNYSTDLTNLTSAGYQEVVFNGSGLYDTDPAVGGHQPLLFDEIMAMYDYYFVYMSSIKVDIFPQASGALTSYGSVYHKPTSSVGGLMGGMTLTQLREQPNLKMGRFNYYWARGNSFTFGPVRHQDIQRTWSVKNPDCSGNVGANPADNVFHHIVWVAPDESTALNIKVRFKLTYWVEFYNVDEFIDSS